MSEEQIGAALEIKILEKFKGIIMEDDVYPTKHTVYDNIRAALITARQKTYSAVNVAMVEAYWDIGRQIMEAQDNSPRAEYGAGLIKFLAERLTAEFGKGFTETNLKYMRQFYAVFPIRHTLCDQLSWSHYRLLMKIGNTERREFYLKECTESNWSVRQLERQISTFYYERLLATKKESRESVKKEIQKTEPKTAPDYILKDPYILEFLDLKENKNYHESELEQALVDHLQEFLLELGKGFSFVARQKRITIDGDHYYIDLVFYNYLLKCFVVIDLKTGKLTYQDIGQIDFYVRYFEENIKQDNDNPTIGIILCSEKNDVMVKYSVLSDNKRLFASKYMLYLPTEEELKRELERERLLIEKKLGEDSHDKKGSHRLGERT
jgi:predicted nuclease of restriction endonuclease-like (RecB) superfamily